MSEGLFVQQMLSCHRSVEEKCEEAARQHNCSFAHSLMPKGKKAIMIFAYTCVSFMDDLKQSCFHANLNPE